MAIKVPLNSSVCFIPDSLTILFPLSGIPYSLVYLEYLDLFYKTLFSFHFLQETFTDSRDRIHNSLYQVHASIVLLIQSGAIDLFIWWIFWLPVMDYELLEDKPVFLVMFASAVPST